MEQRILLSDKALQLTIQRLCHQLIENHQDFNNTVLIGIQPRGSFLARRIHSELKSLTGNAAIKLGLLDVTFYRDDFRTHDKPLIPSANQIDFIVENKKVVLIDDVLYTGRTIRSALDALIDLGRPEKVELMVLIDRRFTRDLPIQPDYTGKKVDTINSQKVKVSWKETDNEDKVYLINN